MAAKKPPPANPAESARRGELLTELLRNNARHYRQYRQNTPALTARNGVLVMEINTQALGAVKIANKLIKLVKQAELGEYAAMSHGGAEVEVSFRVNHLKQAAATLHEVMARHFPTLTYQLYKAKPTQQMVTEFKRAVKLAQTLPLLELERVAGSTTTLPAP